LKRTPVIPLPIASHPTPPLRRLRNLLIQHRPRLRRAPFPKPWPDFTELEVVIAESINVFVDRFGNEKPYDKGPRFFFYFPQVSA